MHFGMKNTLKNNHNYTPKQAFLDNKSLKIKQIIYLSQIYFILFFEVWGCHGNYNLYCRLTPGQIDRYDFYKKKLLNDEKLNFMENYEVQFSFEALDNNYLCH